jgi:hypothetical protein
MFAALLVTQALTSAKLCTRPIYFDVIQLSDAGQFNFRHTFQVNVIPRKSFNNVLLN